MNAKLVEEIANAVLYEGYMLYPYRPSSVKNRQRWNFGVVYPRNYSELQKGTDPWSTQTECLVAGNSETNINIKVRFLQGISRTTAELETPMLELPDNAEPKLRDAHHNQTAEPQTWQEGAEREVVVESRPIGQILLEPVSQSFTLPPSRITEPVRDAQGRVAKLIVRTQEAISGSVSLSAAVLKPELYKVTLTVSNETELSDADTTTRDRAVMRSLLSAHSILSVEHGEFVSLLETPDVFKENAAQCKNTGTWPVLVGEDGQRDAMLSSPIILYDYPQIAPESAGDLFDGTEIDEILALRILTLTENEKQEMREGDERARQILERTEALPEEQFLKLHGVLRGMRPSSEGRQ
jgi:hydrogenase maturation protease